MNVPHVFEKSVYLAVGIKWFINIQFTKSSFISGVEFIRSLMILCLLDLFISDTKIWMSPATKPYSSVSLRNSISFCLK